VARRQDLQLQLQAACVTPHSTPMLSVPVVCPLHVAASSALKHLRPYQPKGILEGEEAPDEMILWLNHPGITARSVEDIAIVLDILIERNEQIKKLTLLV